MKFFAALSACLASAAIFTPAISQAASSVNIGAHAVAQKMATANIPFIKNLGQSNSEDVSYYARLFSGTLFVTKNSDLVYSFFSERHEGTDNKDFQTRWALRESFVGANKSKPEGTVPSEVHISEFKGNKPAGWRRQLPAYERVDLGEVYPGIRVQLKAAGNNVEKLFYLAPGAKAAAIKIAVQGARATKISGKGQLLLKTGLGDVAFTEPVAYQEINGERRPVDVAYTLADTYYGFTLGTHNPAYGVVIDPLVASTFIGGTDTNPAWTGNYDQDIAYSIKVSTDSVYIGGVTQSTDFPVTLGYDQIPDANGRPDGFIARFSRDLSTLYSATFIGTDNFDSVQAIALDTDGTVVAVGQAGYGFPVTPGAYNYQGSEPVGGGFVAKFSADLSSLVASAVVIPSNYPLQVTIGNGGIYFGGSTNNPSFPITANAFLNTCCVAGSFGIRDYDGFAGRISSDLHTLEALTYLGGNTVTGIAVAPDSSVYISDGGDTAITGSLSHFDADLTTRFTQVTYYPGTTSGSSRHYFNDVVVAGNSVIAVGQTYLNDLPVTSGVFDTACGSDGDCDNSSTSLYIPKPDGFIAKYSLDLQTVQAMTYFGGNDAESIRSVGVDGAGNVYVSGETISTDMPVTANGYDTGCGTDRSCNPSGPYDTKATDTFVAKLTGDLTQLLYGSYLGGSNSDYVHQLTVTADDTMYVTGKTDSADFPTTSGAFDTTYAGGTSGSYDSDAFVSQIDTAGSTPGGGSGGGGGGTNIDPVANAGSDQTVRPKQTVYLDGRGSSDSDGTIVRYEWAQVSGRRVTLNNVDSAVANFVSPNVRRGRTRTLVFELTVTDDQGATATDQVTVVVTR